MEINLANLEHNYKTLCSIMPQCCEMMAVVKADAYGHGAIPIAKHLNAIGVKSFAVSSLEEGIALRKSGVGGNILILGWTSPKHASCLKAFGLSQAIVDYAYAVELSRTGVELKAHLAIDTGMHRLGIPYERTDEAVKVFKLDNLNISGIYTHLCSTKSLSKEAFVNTEHQIGRLEAVIACLKTNGIQIPAVHAQSSYGLLNYPHLKYDYARIGDALYGMADKRYCRIEYPELKPVASLKSRIVQLKEIKKGETIGYGGSFTAERDSRIAVLSIGFADGVSRNITEQAHVLVRGKRAAIVRSTCMDFMFADVTDIDGVNKGDTAVLIGRDNDMEITPVDFAEFSDTIPGESLSKLSSRIKRIYIK